MTDDPTTKPCWNCDGVGEFYDGPAFFPCDICKETGRVPMDTAELLEALCETSAQDWVSIGIDFSTGKRWVGTENSRDGDCSSHDADTFDEALRAALRAGAGAGDFR